MAAIIAELELLAPALEEYNRCFSATAALGIFATATVLLVILTAGRRTDVHVSNGARIE
jgi:hypothetical protein